MNWKSLAAWLPARTQRPAKARRYRPTLECLEDRLAPANLPAGFTEVAIATGLSSATAMEFSPQGLLFVAEQAGHIEVWQDGSRVQANFFRDTPLTVNSSGERGLLGIAFDPDYATNRYVYVYYTATTPAVHNRVSRFTANAAGDLALAGSETVILDLNNLSGATNHNGGAIHFGPDGKLYVAAGENAQGSNAQSLNNLLGKILRINADGTIPTDNPFYNTASGQNRAIWALGLRNPFTFAFQPGTGRMFINDVGQQTWEEINDGFAGANYGWPATEGNTNDPDFEGPFYTYDHDEGCAITGGAFYNPESGQFPTGYWGDYFFADFCGDWIRRIDLTTGNVGTFATGAASVVDLRVAADGSLYYLSRGGGRVMRVQYTADLSPAVTEHPAGQTVAPGTDVTFSVRATGSAPLSYQWQRNGVDIPGATAPDLALTNVGPADDGDAFRAVVTNSLGSATSNAATLTVIQNAAPTATITSPANGTLYTAGDTINFSGTGTDPEDGTLPASAFTWEVLFHHADHTHPHVLPFSGAKTGSFTIPTQGETAANVFYRIHLTVTDSEGLSHATFVDVVPRTATVTLQTNPGGLELTLDGQPVTAPTSFVGVAGMERTLSAPASVDVGGTLYVFDSWSDGGAATHTIATPASNTTYTANYVSLGDTLVSRWDFAESGGTTAADSAGNNPATLYNGPTFVASGRTGGGNALQFDGVNDYARVEDAPDLDNTPQLTLSFWVNPALLGSKARGLIGKRASSTSRNAYSLFFKNGRLKVDIKGSDDRFTSNTVFATNTWYHIAVTFDGRLPQAERVKLYVNGTLDKVAAENGTAIPDFNSRLFFGWLKGAAKSYFTGRLDDVRIYDHALPPEVIQAVMNGDASGTQAPAAAAAKTSVPSTRQAGAAPAKGPVAVDVQSALAQIKSRIRRAFGEGA